MERATPTLNRFITYTPGWLAKGFVLFVVLIFFGSCIDETSFIGVRREARFNVEYREFDLPATTIQIDSTRTQNFVWVEGDVDRLMVGQVSSAIDPNFGNTTAKFFAQYIPFGKISTERTQVTLKSLTVTLALDYYVYGDSNSADMSFAMHKITDEGGTFKGSNPYFSNSPAPTYDLTALANSNYYYNKDSIRHRRKLYSQGELVLDTLHFELPTGTGSLAQLLLDTALRKGVYTEASNGDMLFDPWKTDSVFLQTFKGIAVFPVASANKILGIRINRGSTMLLRYTYVDSQGKTQNGKYYYYFVPQQYSYRPIPSFSKIDFDRAGTSLETLSSKNSEFNAPDGYCYLQSGTGLFTKLDISEVHQYFDTIPKLSVNNAELIVTLEPTATRSHIHGPLGLVTRLVKGNRLFQGDNSNYGPLTGYYHAGYSFGINYDYFFDAYADGGGTTTLGYLSSTDGRFYRGYMTDFLHYQLNLPSSVEKIYAIGLLPAHGPFGKSFYGTSFKKEKVKLKVYYTRVL